jgi:hypothetical protein
MPVESRPSGLRITGANVPAKSASNYDPLGASANRALALIEVEGGPADLQNKSVTASPTSAYCFARFAERHRPTTRAIVKKAGAGRSKAFASYTFQYSWTAASNRRQAHDQYATIPEKYHVIQNK